MLLLMLIVDFLATVDRCAAPGAPRNPDIAVAGIVGKNEDDVRPLLLRRGRGQTRDLSLRAPVSGRPLRRITFVSGD
jgi:hypothetical protein